MQALFDKKCTQAHPITHKGFPLLRLSSVRCARAHGRGRKKRFWQSGFPFSLGYTYPHGVRFVPSGRFGANAAQPPAAIAACACCVEPATAPLPTKNNDVRRFSLCFRCARAGPHPPKTARCVPLARALHAMAAGAQKALPQGVPRRTPRAPPRVPAH